MFSLWHLKYFRDAVDKKSLAAAAKQNSVSASAVSQAIKSLEEQLGCELLRHGKNQFEVTEQGKLAYEHGGEILLRIDHLRSGISETQGKPKGKISFATQHSIATTFLPNALVKLRRLYPELIASFSTQTREGVRDLVLQRQIDFAISVDNIEFSGLESHTVGAGEFGCFLHRSIKFTPDLPFLLSGETPDTVRLRQAFSKTFKCELKSSMEVKSWTVIRELALKGLGIGFVPCYIVSPEDGKFLQKIPGLRLKVPYEICIYHLKQLPLTRNAKAFVDIVQTVLPKTMTPIAIED